MSFVAVAIAGGAALAGAGIKTGAGFSAANRQEQQGRMQAANTGLNSQIYNRLYSDKIQPMLEEQYGRRQDITEQYKEGLGETRDILGTQLTMYQNLANQGMPEEEKRMLMDAAAQSAANSVSQAGSARGSLLGAMNANKSLTDTYRDIASESARMRQQNMINLAAQTGNYAQSMQGLNQQEMAADMGLENYYSQAYIDPELNMMNMAMGAGQKQQDLLYGSQQAAMGTRNSAWQAAGDTLASGGSAAGNIYAMKGQ